MPQSTSIINITAQGSKVEYITILSKGNY